MVFKRRFDENGHIVRYKARIVSMGYFQKNGVYYDKTFAPVVMFNVLLLLLGRFVAINWHVHHADISPTF